MRDIELIKKIENEVDFDLFPVKSVSSEKNGYMLNHAGNVSGLVLNGIEGVDLGRMYDFFSDFSSLRFLSFCGNNIQNAEPLLRLKGLQKLKLDDNKICDLSGFERLENLLLLSLNDNDVNDLSQISDMHWLWGLSLRNNKIRRLESLFKLKSLRELILDYNDVDDLAPLSVLVDLWRLSLHGNKVGDVGALSNLKVISSLNLTSNHLLSLPQWMISLSLPVYWRVPSFYGEAGIFVYDNPIESPPPEIIARGTSSIKNYYKQLFEQDTDYLFEAKLLIVGEPGAGKTSMARKLVNPDCELPAEDESTRGIDVFNIDFLIQSIDFPQIVGVEKNENRKFRINIWDFGGQEIYKATHRFFLTNRSLYALVADNRREDTDFNYWLHITEMFGGDSPLIIVQNEKQQRRRDLDILIMRGRFKNICSEVIDVNFKEKSNGRLQKLEREIRQQLIKLPHVGNCVPAKWTLIRSELENDKRYTISLGEYLEICSRCGIGDRRSSMVLSQYFNDIGVFLHFQNDPILKNVIFLNPDWATNAVYKILDSSLLDTKQGYFSVDDADSIWDEKEYGFLRDELLRLMTMFFLAYKVEGANIYIVPDKLPGKRPEYCWDDAENLCLKYDYDFFMPKGIMSQFIVQMHSRFLKDQNKVWRRGCVLEREGAIAEIVEAYDARSVEIRISGQNKRDFMTVIVDQLDKINAQYEKMKVEKLIPCRCDECRGSDDPYYYKYSDLKRRIEKSRSKVECGKSYEMVVVKELIYDMLNFKVIENKRLTDKGKVRNKIFVSYSHKDVFYLDRLRIHVKALINEGFELELWDDAQIKAGYIWEKEIQRGLLQAGVAIVLVSSDFLSSEFIMGKELPPLLQAAEKDGTVILPVIVSPCRFEKSPLSVFQAVNDPKKPLSKLNDSEQDEAFIKLVDRIEELISG